VKISSRKDAFWFKNWNDCIFFNTYRDQDLVKQWKLGVLGKLIQSVNTLAVILILIAAGAGTTGARATESPAGASAATTAGTS